MWSKCRWLQVKAVVDRIPRLPIFVTLKRPLRKHGWKNFPMSGLFKIFPGRTNLGFPLESGLVTLVSTCRKTHGGCGKSHHRNYPYNETRRHYSLSIGDWCSEIIINGWLRQRGRAGGIPRITFCKGCGRKGISH